MMGWGWSALGLGAVERGRALLLKQMSPSGAFVWSIEARDPMQVEGHGPFLSSPIWTPQEDRGRQGGGASAMGLSDAWAARVRSGWGGTPASVDGKLVHGPGTGVSQGGWLRSRPFLPARPDLLS